MTTPSDPNDIHHSSRSEDPDQSARSSQSSLEDTSSPSDHREHSYDSSQSGSSDESSSADQSSYDVRSSHSSQSASSEASSPEDRSSQSASSDHSSRKERAEPNAYDDLIITFLSKALKLNKKISAKDLCLRINKKLPPGKKPLTEQMLAAIKIRLKKQNLLPSSSQADRSDQSSRPAQSDREDSKTRKERSVRAERSAQKEQDVRQDQSDSSWREDLSARFDSFPLLPKKEKQGRKETRDRVKLSLTLDTNLYRIIEAEAEKRYWPIAVTFEWALWNLLGNPPLSYSPVAVEEPTPEPETEKRGSGRKPKGTKAEEPKPEKKGQGGRRKKTS